MDAKTADGPTLAPGIEPPKPRAKMPGQIPYIIANEGCERFSFYGMRNILTPFLKTSMLIHLHEAERGIAATEVFHTFVMGVYFFPLLGGWLADRFFGKYNTILWFSIIYCIGHGFLAAFWDNRPGFYVGLGLIALGSGGIKPLVASFMGDQFDSKNKHLAKIAFDGFYWIINFGSFFASLSMPWLLKHYGAELAFGVPGILMGVATVVFVMGRKRYVRVPPAPPNADSFMRVVMTALFTEAPGKGRPGLGVAVLGVVLAVASLGLWIGGLLDPVPAICLGIVLVIGLGCWGTAMQLERARGKHADQAIDGVRSLFGVFILFIPVSAFWSLFDQKSSTWVLQADAMAKPEWFVPAQMQALNPALVMVLIPINNFIVFPWLRRRGWEPTTLRRMTAGLVLSGIAWIIVGAMQVVLDGGTTYSIVWQILPYAFLTTGEVLVSATGLEFAYSQAPPSMKGVVMSFWYLAVTIGGLWVLLANAALKNETVTHMITDGAGMSTTAFYMFFFAGFALLAALAFGLYARRYREVDNYRSAAS